LKFKELALNDGLAILQTVAFFWSIFIKFVLVSRNMTARV